MSKNVLFSFIFLFSLTLSAQNNYKPVIDEEDNFSPDVPLLDYYASAFKLYGTALRNELHNLTKNHITVSYSSLWTHFQNTDKKSNGKVWDMYSDVPNGTPAYQYTFVTNQCGNYSGEGDCYNREHSWPQSWFNQSTIPTSDINHLFPTDGYVNGRRSNWPFGEVSSPTWISTNGGKLGPNTTSGYSGTAFEPINEYKGDLARAQFYMSVRYYLEDGSWSSSEGTSKSDLLTWYANLLNKWNLQDSVSTKEINRNNAIAIIQGKRNPFIDHPEFATEIWMTSMAPKIVSMQYQNNTIFIDFSRYLDSASAANVNNYIISNGGGSPVSVTWGINNDVSKLQINLPQLLPGTNYTVQLKNLKSINSVAMSDTVISFKTDGISSISEAITIPSSIQLEQNYPNPFNPSTRIKFSLPEDGNVSLKVYDALGKEAAVLVNGFISKGSHSVKWNAEGLTSGLYIYILKSGTSTLTKKLLLMK